MADKKTIYCPKCNRKVATYDGKGQIDIITSCKKCDKMIIYRVKTGKTEIKKKPERNCSSGMVFI